MNGKVKTAAIYASSAAVGLISGFFGGGGGMLCVPLLQLRGLPVKQAHATALIVILPLCIVSAAIYIANGYFDTTAVLCAGVEQHLAQAINLIAFVPMSIIAICIHKKNGYVCFKQAAPIAGIALIGAVSGSFAANYAGGYVLRACFGTFLIVLGIIQMFKVIKTAVKNYKAKKRDEAYSSAQL